MKTILCYGDSNAWGFVPAMATRHPRDVRWPRVMASALGAEYELIEDSIRGRTSVFAAPSLQHRCGLNNLGYSLLAHAPLDLVILGLGTNDLKFTDSDGSARGIAKLIDCIKRADILYEAFDPVFAGDKKILLIAPPHIHSDISRTRPGHSLAHAAEESRYFGEKYRKVAEDKGVYFLDAAQIVTPSPADCLHLEPGEHKKLGLAVAEKVREIFAES